MASAWSGTSTPPGVSERGIRQSLLYAPRNLKCSWSECEHATDTFGSIQALMRHIKFMHSSSLPIPSFSRNRVIPCKFKGCKILVATNDELYKHVETQHLETIRSTCYLCTFQDRAPHAMLTHLRIRHKISDSEILDRTFSQPPPLPTQGWPTITKPMETCNIITPRVASNPDFDPSVVMAARRSEKMDVYDFLDEELRDAEQMNANAMASNVKWKQREPLDTDILLGTNYKPLEGPMPSALSFHAGLRNPPTTRATLSNGFPYRLGRDIVPKSPPSVVVGYFSKKDAILPTL